LPPPPPLPRPLGGRPPPGGPGGGGAGDPPPGWGDNLHGDLTLASSEEGGGSFVIAYDFDEPVETTFVQCFGGEAPDCAGGLSLFAAEDPGFVALAVDSAAEDLHALPDETEVTLELVAADEGASLSIEGETLQQPGDTVMLGSTPDLHAHGSWLLAIPGGTEPQESYSLTIRVVAGGGFDASPDYVVQLHAD
jgi:hypothetical protein